MKYDDIDSLVILITPLSYNCHRFMHFIKNSCSKHHIMLRFHFIVHVDQILDELCLTDY